MKKRVVCFGDSNTWGYCGVDASRYEDDVRWTGKLQKMLGEGYTIVEEGHNGRTTVWDDPVENRLAGLTYLWPCMESHSPFDLIIIMLGTNDTKARFCVSAKNIAKSAGRLVDLAQKSPFGRGGNAPKVLLVSPIGIEDVKVFADSFGAQAAQKAKDFAENYKLIAEEMGCYFMNAAEFASPDMVDGVHMNEEGHDRLAVAMANKVKEIFSE